MWLGGLDLTGWLGAVHAAGQFAPPGARLAPCGGAEEHVQPADGVRVVFTLATHITHP